MIRESRRAEFAGKAIAGVVPAEEIYPKSVAKRAFEFADAMLAEWEKEAKENGRAGNL
jgi:hypothetical protein